MTDYETARLALQQASVGTGRASVWAPYVQAGVAGVIGGLQYQHTENMVALRTLIERSASSRQ